MALYKRTGTNRSCYHTVSHLPCGTCLIGLRTQRGKERAPAHGLKSPGDVTVAPVVPTAVSTHRSRNELRWDAPGPRTDRPLSEEALAVTLSAQTHLPMVSRLVQGTLIIHLSEKDCKFNIRIL